MYIDSIIKKVNGVEESSVDLRDKRISEFSSEDKDKLLIVDENANIVGKKPSELLLVDIEAGKGIDVDKTETSKPIISHKDTSSFSGVSKSDNTYLSSLTVDEFGHITNADTTLIEGSGITTVTENDNKVLIDTSTVASESGSGLMSSTDFTKLSNIEEDAQVNIIEDVKVDNSSISVENKSVNIDTSKFPLSDSAKEALEGKADKTDLTNYLPIAGGELTGSLSLKSNKLTALPQATDDTDAVQYKQLLTLLEQINADINTRIIDPEGKQQGQVLVYNNGKWITDYIKGITGLILKEQTEPNPPVIVQNEEEVTDKVKVALGLTELGYVPITRTVNKKELSEDIELNADDVNAAWPAIIGSGYPSESTEGKLGQFYIMNTAPYAEYICTEINEVEGVKKYTWKTHLTDIVVENNTIYGASLSVVPENHEIKILV